MKNTPPKRPIDFGATVAGLSTGLGLAAMIVTGKLFTALSYLLVVFLAGLFGLLAGYLTSQEDTKAEIRSAFMGENTP